MGNKERVVIRASHVDLTVNVQTPGRVRVADMIKSKGLSGELKNMIERALNEITNIVDIWPVISKQAKSVSRLASERNLKEGLEEAQRGLNGPADPIFGTTIFSFPPKPTQMEMETEWVGQREPRPLDPV